MTGTTAPAALAGIAPIPHPDTAGIPAVARWLAVELIRMRARRRGNPDWLPAGAEAHAEAAFLAALHFARALDFICGHPEYALPRRADRAAQEVAAAWRDGDLDEHMYIYCGAYGLDYDAVRGMADAEVAADRARIAGDGRTDPPQDRQAQAQAEAYRLLRGVPGSGWGDA